MLTVTTAATEFKLISASVAREALSIDHGEDAALTKLIIRASDVIARECNRVFALETVTEQCRFTCRADHVILTRFPVVAVASLVENDTALVDATDFEVDKQTGIVTRLRNDRAWQWPALSKIVVVYSSGYDLPLSAPAALQQACIQLVKSYYIGADRDPIMRSETVDQLSAASYFDTSIPPDVLGLIEKFRTAR
jgi:hypothetical protein